MGKCKIWETQCSYGHVAGAKKKFVNCAKCKMQNKNCSCTVLISPYYRASLIKFFENTAAATTDRQMVQ